MHYLVFFSDVMLNPLKILMVTFSRYFTTKTCKRFQRNAFLIYFNLNCVLWRNKFFVRVATKTISAIYFHKTSIKRGLLILYHDAQQAIY